MIPLPPSPTVTGEQLDGLWFVVMRPQPDGTPIVLTADAADQLAAALAASAATIRAGFKLATYAADAPVVPA